MRFLDLRATCSRWLSYYVAFFIGAAGSALAQNTPVVSSVPASITTSAVLYGQTGNAMPVNPALPTIWIIGDSTVRNGQGNGAGNGQWGWGAPIEYYFDRAKINVVNRALGGTSSRTFYNNNWKGVLANIKKGDFVFMQFGHNDKNGDLTGANAGIGSLNGAGDETQEATGRGGSETVHTFGWYMKQYVEDTKAAGATPIVCSLIPRKIWEGAKLMRVNADYFDYATWAAQVASAENVAYVDLHEITARKYDLLGEKKVEPMFVPVPSEHTHTDWYGAIINAESVIGGLKALKNNPLANYFSARGVAIPAIDLNNFTLTGTSTESSAAAAMGAQTTPAPAPTPAASAAAPASANAAIPTLYIIGDSTANSNSGGILGWGTPFASYFDPAKVRVQNKAIAGRSSRSYMLEGHWDPIVAQIKSGDFVLLQFGHNDLGDPANANGRPSLPGLGEETTEVTARGGPVTVHTYGWYMRKYISDAQAKGAHVVVVTVTVRDIWTNPNAEFDSSSVATTANILTKKDNYNPADDRVERGVPDGHGNTYTELSHQLARAQNVPLVDLTNLNADKIDKMGRETAMKFYQTQKVDHTHSNPAGADFNAVAIVSGLKALKDSPFLALLSEKGQAVQPADAKYVADNLPTTNNAATVTAPIAK